MVLVPFQGQALGEYTLAKDFPFDHKGFTVDCFPPHWLYGIIAPDGYDPPQSLQGWFTTASLVTKQIDDYLAANPKKTLASMWIKKELPKRRGRPTGWRKNKKPKTKEDNAETINNDTASV